MSESRRRTLGAAGFDGDDVGAGRAEGERGLQSDDATPGPGTGAPPAALALALEATNRRVADLPAPAAWDALRDVAELAAAVPVLDTDLAAALLPGLSAARAVLTDPAGHALVRVAADAVRAATTGLPRTR